MRNPLHIGISGCGIGGMASACLLSDSGHHVTIFVQFKMPSPVGSGLVIQPVGQNILARIGVLDAALNYGQRIFKMYGEESHSHNAVLNVDYGPHAAERTAYAVLP